MSSVVNFSDLINEGKCNTCGGKGWWWADNVAYSEGIEVKTGGQYKCECYHCGGIGTVYSCKHHPGLTVYKDDSGKYWHK